MIGDQLDEMSQESHRILQEWLESCTRGRKIARNTAAIGIVVLDHLKRKCPVSREEVISRGGEVKGARSGLGERLERYSIPSHYLKEITTRQAHQDGQRLFERFAWGEKLAELANNDRDSLLLELIDTLRGYAFDWLERQNLKFEIDRRQSPIVWIYQIVENAKARSGGVVEQHLIGAKLQRRFTGKQIPNFPAHAGDSQTGRGGDFAIEDLVYHVTASPGRVVVKR